MKDFTLYPEAFALKELGFDEPCFGYFHDGKLSGVNKWDRKDWEFHIISNKDITNTIHEIVLAPTYSQAFRFFREKYNLHCWVGCKTLDNGETVYIGNGRTIPNTLSNGFIVDIIPYEPKPTPEEAELACLRKLIELVKTK